MPSIRYRAYAIARVALTLLYMHMSPLLPQHMWADRDMHARPVSGIFSDYTSTYE